MHCTKIRTNGGTILMWIGSGAGIEYAFESHRVASGPGQRAHIEVEFRPSSASPGRARATGEPLRKTQA